MQRRPLAPDDARDAARWRALVGVDRIRVNATSHPAHSNPPSGSRYLAIELWSKSDTPQSQFGVVELTKFVDAILNEEDS